MTLSQKAALLVDQAKLLRIKIEEAIASLEPWETVRHEYGQTRKTMRSIQAALHKIAKKIRQEKARKAMEEPCSCGKCWHCEQRA